MSRKINFRQIAFAAAVIASLAVIGYFSLNPRQDTATSPVYGALDSRPAPEPLEEQPEEQQENKALPEVDEPQNQTDPALDPEANADETSKAEGIALRILKSDVTSRAKFFPYQLDGVKMEVLAVKAADGTVRTAFNTCQVCYNSGRGYYVQSGQYLVCQNCGNMFHVDQVEVIRGGCNPIPIMKEDKQDDGKYILITEAFMAGSKDYFSSWKKA